MANNDNKKTDKSGTKTLTVAPAGQSKTVKEEKESAKSVQKTHTKGGGKKQAFPFGTVLIVITLTLLFMMLVSNYVQLNEYAKEAEKLNDALEELKIEEKKLSSDLENKVDKIAAEKYASGELGLVGSSEIEKKYVEISEDEKIEVYEVEEDGTLGAITSALFVFTDNLIESWNTLLGNE